VRREEVVVKRWMEEELFIASIQSRDFQYEFLPRDNSLAVIEAMRERRGDFLESSDCWRN